MPQTVTLGDVQIELVRREMLQTVARDLRWTADALDDLGIVAPWEGLGVKIDDTRGSVRMARESLDLLDAVGWPEVDA